MVCPRNYAYVSTVCCFGVVWHWSVLPISVRVISLVLRQSIDVDRASQELWRIWENTPQIPAPHGFSVNCSEPLHWRHNDQDSVSNHQPHGCLLSRLFRGRSKKTSKLRVTSICAGNSAGPVNSPHKGLVTREMFPFDDVIMSYMFMIRCLNFASYYYNSVKRCSHVPIMSYGSLRPVAPFTNIV